jgi:predicted PurR-regulated permease PerM
MDEQSQRTLTRRVVLGIFIAGLLVLSYQVLQFFLVPVAWAGILAFVTWPLHARLVRAAPSLPNLTALAMTVALAAAFVVPVVWLVVVIKTDFWAAYLMLRDEFSIEKLRVPDFIRAIPWLGDQLQSLLDRLAGDREAMRNQVLVWIEPWLGKIGVIAGNLTHMVANMGLALLTVFFFYRDGVVLAHQFGRVLRLFVGRRAQRYVRAIGDTTKAVVYGIVLTAIAQGTLAGFGYWVAGLRAPALLGGVTALIALVPFGTPFAWGTAGVWLLMTGETVAGIGLLLWGGLVVSSVDNLIRPLVISSATRIPFLLVMFGVIGGLVAFGPVGLFLGPVVLAVLLAVWHEWLEGARPTSIASNGEASAAQAPVAKDATLPPEQAG